MAKKTGAQYGNKNAAKGRIWSDAVRKALLSGKKLDAVARKLVEMACDGDIQAIKEIGDRLDGKAQQAIVGEVIHKHVKELSDNDLLAIATGSAGAVKEEDSEEKFH